ncbi:hypothetical protein FRC07_004558 [Ceratobasidium sp. 392]|nr:hypothetical protein FRC07_004558 [Ceratobasidium sp. 392]
MSNNSGPKPPVARSLKDLTSSEMVELLEKNGDESTGPLRSSSQIATSRTAGPAYSASWVREENAIDTEIIRTNRRRDANYIREGWSQSTLSTLAQLPWVSSRVPDINETAEEGSWATKKTIVKGLAVNIPIRAIKPVPEFEAEIQEALEKDTKEEQFRAVYDALAYWGDVLPLSFELGKSVSITDKGHNTERGGTSTEPISVLSSGDQQPMEGGVVATEGDLAWRFQNASPSSWSVVRVLKVVPTSQLLRTETQSRLADLHSTLLSFLPAVVDGSPVSITAWSGNSHVLRTVLGVSARAQYTRMSVHAIYATRDASEYVFQLFDDEKISDVVVWTLDSEVTGVQFVTTRGRVSPPYGGLQGVPTIMNSEGGTLAAFLNHSGYRLQTVWRHDIVLQKKYRVEARYSEYVGKTDGEPFNDWAFSGHSHAAHISCIDVWSGRRFRHSSQLVVGIQVTYTEQRGNQKYVKQAPQHGGFTPEYLKQSFPLEPDEHITKILGFVEMDNNIAQLKFVTNKGRVSPGFGRDSGTKSFECSSQMTDGQQMRLAFIGGKWCVDP